MTVVSVKTPSERKCVLDLAMKVLRGGGVIAYPTETVYGLGCDPRNAKALARIFRIKGREKGKPVLLVAANVGQVKKVAHLSPQAKHLATKYWPGPLTLVLPSMGRKKDIAIRVSSDPFVRALALRFGFPIVSTSANRSGRTPCRSARAIVSAFVKGPQPDLVIDGGALPKRAPSTVARVCDDGTVEVLRKGAIRL